MLVLEHIISLYRTYLTCCFKKTNKTYHHKITFEPKDKFELLFYCFIIIPINFKAFEKLTLQNFHFHLEREID